MIWIIVGVVIMFLLLTSCAKITCPVYFKELVDYAAGVEQISSEIVSKPKPIIKVDSFIPTTFDEYIGQEKAKKIIQTYIKATEKRNMVFPHILLHGKTGCGKTTLAKIVACELGVPIVTVIGSEIKDSEQIISLIQQADGGFLFIDEIHAISREVAEKLYPIMESFYLGDIQVKEFTLVGATTELGEILKDRKPLFNRFKISIELENYTEKDLGTIAEQYKNRKFPNDVVESNIYSTLAKNCRGTPRFILSMLEAVIYFNGDVKEVLNSYGIIKNGFTTKDLQILKYIAENEKGVGLQGIVSYLDTSSENYTYEIEPYLLRNNLIVRTARGRKITESGINFIKELV